MFARVKAVKRRSELFPKKRAVHRAALEVVDGRIKSGHNELENYEHPVVDPHVSHFKHVPFRTSVKFPHSPQASPS